MPCLVCRQLFAAFLLPLAAAQTLIDKAESGTVLAQAKPFLSNETLTCQVEAITPFLNIGLRLQTGYIFRVPKTVSEPSNKVTVLTTITPDRTGEPAYLVERMTLPPAINNSNYESIGTFFIGDGHYHVNWLLFDDTGRTCWKKWELNAELGRADGKSKLVIAPNSVTDVAMIAASAAARRTAAPRKRFTVLLDAAPISDSHVGDSFGSTGSGRFPLMGQAGRGVVGDPTSKRVPLPTDPFGVDPVAKNVFGPRDQVLLLGALAALLEHLPASTVRLVVFNLDYQRELLRHEGFSMNSLNEVAHAIEQLQLTGIDYHVLQNRTGHIDLLAKLINRELRDELRSDVVVFLGPRERFHDQFPNGALDVRGGLAPRFFYLAYQFPGAARGTPYSGLSNAGVGGNDISDSVQTIARSGGLIMSGSPDGLPDTLSRAVGKLKGKTINIESPGQFAKAVRQIERSAGR